MDNSPGQSPGSEVMVMNQVFTTNLVQNKVNMFSMAKLLDRERRNPKTCRLETRDRHYQLALGAQPLLE